MSETEDKAYIQHLETTIKNLNVELERLKKEKGLSGPSDGLSFDDHKGIWSAKDGKHFCPKCLDKGKRNQLRTDDDDGWRCMVCDEFYYNPDAPSDSVRFVPDGRI